MNLEIENLTHVYYDGNQKRTVLNNLNYNFESGKFYVILGHSGSGKTTLLSLMAGLDKLQKGDIKYNGQSIKKIKPDYYRSSKVGIVFQSYNLINYLTAKENVLLAMSISENNLANQQEVIAYNLLEFLGLNKSKADRIVNKLSGGEQQRVAIARALASDSQIILADEPTGNLDVETEKDLINIFQVLAREYHKCIVLVSHSNEVANQADVVLRLKKGEIINE